MNLIFDYDGTLNNCLKTYRPAFNKAYQWLVEHGYAESKTFSDKEISYWLGFTGTEMWKQFMPNLDYDIREFCRNMISTKTINQVKSGNAEWYPHAREILKQLKQDGHTLIFLSNCRRQYLEAHNAVFQLDELFDNFYYAEAFNGIPKYEIFQRFQSEYTGEFVAIGDRFHDIELATKNHLKSIGCLYGYATDGELNQATVLIHDITELPTAIKNL